MDTEREEFLKRINKIRSKIHSIKRQYNGKEDNSELDQGDHGRQLVAKGLSSLNQTLNTKVFTGWNANISVDGETIPLTETSFVTKGKNIKVAVQPDKSASEILEEAQDKDEKTYPFAITVSTITSSK